MALQFDKDNIFFHIPKTGGNFVRSVLSKIAKETAEVGDSTISMKSHCTPLQIERGINLHSKTTIHDQQQKAISYPGSNHRWCLSFNTPYFM